MTASGFNPCEFTPLWENWSVVLHTCDQHALAAPELIAKRMAWLDKKAPALPPAKAAKALTRK